MEGLSVHVSQLMKEAAEAGIPQGRGRWVLAHQFPREVEERRPCSLQA